MTIGLRNNSKAPDIWPFKTALGSAADSEEDPTNVFDIASKTELDTKIDIMAVPASAADKWKIDLSHRDFNPGTKLGH